MKNTCVSRRPGVAPPANSARFHPFHLQAFLLLLLAALFGACATERPSWPTDDWPAGLPLSEGMDPGALSGLDRDIASGQYGCVDSMTVIRHGKLVWDRSYPHDYAQVYGTEAGKPGPLNPLNPGGPYNYFNPWWHPYYRGDDLHTMQSVTKTVTSVVIGTAVARGEFPSLDTPVLRFFDPAAVANVDDRKQRLTIRHLLTMTAGLDWNEELPYDDPANSCTLMEASADWVRFAVDRPMAAEPGTAFNYNSGASQLLAHIFRAATGRDIEEYAAAHLFAPLGIRQWFWKRIPTGLADTEGGLYLRPHDLARIAYLFLRNGAWEGRTVVTPEWVRRSVAPAVAVSPTGVKYGLKWWLYPYGPGDSRLAWAGSGFGGQMPIVFPDLELVVVFTGWNILPGRPHLTHRIVIDRIRAAVRDRPVPAGS